MAFWNIQVLEVSSNLRLTFGEKQEQHTLNLKLKMIHLQISMRSNSFLKRKKDRDQSKSLQKQHQCITCGKDKLALCFRFLQNKNVAISHQLRSTQRCLGNYTIPILCFFRLVRLSIAIYSQTWSSLDMQQLPAKHPSSTIMFCRMNRAHRRNLNDFISNTHPPSTIFCWMNQA